MAEIYGHFLENEINATVRDVTGPTEQGQIITVLISTVAWKQAR